MEYSHSLVPDWVRKNMLNEISSADLADCMEKKAPIGRTVFVSNVNYDVNVPELRDVFQTAGTVVNVRILKNRFGTSSGKALIEFEQIEEAVRAVETLNSQMHFGRKLVIRMHYFMNARHKTPLSTHSPGIPNRLKENEWKRIMDLNVEPIRDSANLADPTRSSCNRETSVASSDVSTNERVEVLPEIPVEISTTSPASPDSDVEIIEYPQPIRSEKPNISDDEIHCSKSITAGTETDQDAEIEVNLISSSQPISSEKPSNTSDDAIHCSESTAAGAETGHELTTPPKVPSSFPSTNFNCADRPLYASFNVKVKPSLHDKLSRDEIENAQTDLDARVKAVLMYKPTRFKEWLMEQNLIKPEQTLAINVHVKDVPNPKSIPGKQTLYHGSIFDTIHPAQTTLQLIYHWSCQTSAANVLAWTQVTSNYLRDFYTLLRSACMATLHDYCRLMGGNSKLVEIGLARLETANVQSKKKVEILGAFDRTEKTIRLRVVNPENVLISETESPRDVKQILSTLIRWVDKSSILLIDGSIDKNVLLEMGFKNVHRCKPNVPDTLTNATVIDYIQHVIPKVFEKTWNRLSNRLIQQFLDELSWREQWGQTSAKAFDTMITDLADMTQWDDAESLIHRLNRISLNPFGEWSARPSRIRVEGKAGQLPEQTKEPPNDNQPPILEPNHTDNVKARSKRTNSNSEKPPILIPQVQVNSESTFKQYYMNEPRKIGLQNYYYAVCLGNLTPGSDTSGGFPLTLKCPLCSMLFTSNLEVIRHVFIHVRPFDGKPSSLRNLCQYCLKDVRSPKSAIGDHFSEVHKLTDVAFPCLICERDFYTHSNLIFHMWENHDRHEMPYKCGICNYKSSFHYDIINHFGQNHTRRDCVLCPFCLKVLSTKSSAHVTEIVIHLQAHSTRAQKKCPGCILMFTTDAELEKHKSEIKNRKNEVDHNPIPYSVETSAAIRMAKPLRTKRLQQSNLTPPPLKKRKVENTDDKGRKSRFRVKPDRRERDRSEYHSIKLNNKFANPKATESSTCLECNKAGVASRYHFSAYMICVRCRFTTCCRTSMINHNIICHRKGNSGEAHIESSFDVKMEELLDTNIYCGCGFETRNGNKMARHLHKCGKMTALSELPQLLSGDEEEECTTPE